jgi:hypothetical protein
MKFTRHAHHLPLRSIAPLLLALALPISAIASPPPAAVAEGMTVNTYSSNFTAQTVDMNHTLNRGYKWYLYTLFGQKASASGVKINGDGSVTLLGDNTGAEGELMSVNAYPGTNGWVGTAFGGGGYFETVMLFNPAQVVAGHNAGTRYWPSFWSLPMEGTFTGTNQWPGQAAGYQHNVEVDFFEADVYWKTTAYGVGLHDWYGIPNKTCNPGLCSVNMINPSGERDPPAGTNFNTYHTYGVLWVPATATTEGSYSAYFDGVLIGSTRTWTHYANQAPTPVGKPWLFGQMDQQHLFFILGTGQGIPFTLKSVNVWQRSAAGNLTN